jgi:hypothetical protein
MYRRGAPRLYSRQAIRAIRAIRGQFTSVRQLPRGERCFVKLVQFVEKYSSRVARVRSRRDCRDVACHVFSQTIKQPSAKIYSSEETAIIQLNKQPSSEETAIHPTKQPSSNEINSHSSNETAIHPKKQPSSKEAIIHPKKQSFIQRNPSHHPKKQPSSIIQKANHTHHRLPPKLLYFIYQLNVLSNEKNNFLYSDDAIRHPYDVHFL